MTVRTHELALLDLGPQRSLAAVGRELGIMERWSSRWSWVKRVEAYTDHLFRQAYIEQQRRAKREIVSRDETLEELSGIVRGDPNEIPKLRYSDKLRAIELAGKYHRLFTEQIEVTQSVDVNISLVELQASICVIAQSQHISQRDAALGLEEQLADVPELAAAVRELARKVA